MTNSEQYDYTNQAWVVDGKYVRCGHKAEIGCKCFGRQHEGEECESCLCGIGEGDHHPNCPMWDSHVDGYKEEVHV